MTRYIKTLLFLSLFTVSPLFAITLDGELDDPEWVSALTISEFSTVTPFSLEPADYHSQVKIFSNEDGIYIGITNQQPIATQKSERSARDGQIEGDSNTVIIDFDRSGISGYHFEVANGGSMVDGIWRNETSFSNEWDGIWSAHTSNNENYWYSEIFIPWDVAPMISAEDDERIIGLHVKRYVASNSKVYASAPISEQRQRFLSEFKQVSIQDFATSSLQVFGYASWRDNRITGEKNPVGSGIDVFWKPSSSQQLSLTLNPDFGQVEADGLVVNFSPQETFFSENRPFFTENQALFDISGINNLRVLHTRRIGSERDLTSSERPLYDSAAADITGALKFTSVNSQFSYGFFTAMEDSDSVSNGRDFYVGRILRKTDDYSLGYMVTYTGRPEIDRRATVHASDYSYNFSDSFKVNGQLIYSDIEAATEDYSGTGVSANFSHQITDTWEQNLQLSSYGEDLDINDAGFLNRNGYKRADYSTTKQKFDFSDGNLLQTLSYGFGLNYSENSEGERLNSTIRFNSNYTLKDTANGFAFIRFDTDGVDDLITRGNGNLNTDSGITLNGIYFSDRRNKFQWHLRTGFFEDTVNGNGYDVHLHPSYQFSDKYQLKIGWTYRDSDDWLIWQGGNQLNAFAEKRMFTEIDLVANISEKQEISVIFEWISLIAKAKKTYLVNNSGNLVEANLPTEDFNLSIVGLQLHYRYEIAPLSNLFLVYSRGGTARLDDRDSIPSLFTPGWDARDGDNFIIKVRYQF